MPSKTAKTTHKHTLKLKNKEPTVIENDTVFTEALKQAKTIRSLNTMEWENFVVNCSEDELKEMKDYMKHDKANIACKIERLAEKTSQIKSIIRVRDFFNEIIAKSMDLTNDAVINALDEEDCEHNVGGVVKLIDIELRIRKDRNKNGGQNAMQTG